MKKDPHPSQVMLGDGIAGLQRLGLHSVNLLLSDLPSGRTRNAYDHRPHLPAFWAAAWRAVEPQGCVVLMADSIGFAAALIASEPDTFRYDLIWHKSVATGFLNAAAQPLRTHEFVLVFSRVPTVYHPQMIEGASPIHAARRRAHGKNYGPMTQSTEARAGATDRYPTSVLEFASVGTSSSERRHPQQKPVPLLRWLVRTYSQPGDLVVDPYAGSGSTGEAAMSEGRRFLGWDVNPDCVQRHALGCDMDEDCRCEAAS